MVEIQAVHRMAKRFLHRLITSIAVCGYVCTLPLTNAYVLCLSNEGHAQVEVASDDCCSSARASHESGSTATDQSASLSDCHGTSCGDCEDTAVGDLLVSETGRDKAGFDMPQLHSCELLRAVYVDHSSCAVAPSIPPARVFLPSYPLFLRTTILLL